MNNILVRGRDRGVVVLSRCSVGHEVLNSSKLFLVCLVGVSTSVINIAES